MSVIRVTNAHKEYCSKSETKVILKGYNMNVVEGTVYAMMGSSGCGKTTLISCLVGISNLDSGNIEIFGEHTRRNRFRIGYMPQENALIPEFTIREMIWFFGTLFSLSSERIEKRLKFICELLELPNKKKFIKDCSGGQQRRISFALTLVHEPELLILDEPTVGLDPLLRSKIWDYFIEVTATKRVTILITTHYIEEATRSTTVGLMRKGVQVAEDSPRNILFMTGTTSLEAAFLKLSEKQELNATDIECPQIDVATFQDDFMTTVASPIRKSTGSSQSSWELMLALFLKNLLNLYRHPGLIFLCCSIPLIGCFCIHFAIGGRIRGLSIGILNNEVSSIDECFNRSLVTAEVQDSECILHKISCRFINEFDDDIAEKIYFDNYESAYQALKRRDIVGIIYFSSTFTETLPLFNDDFENNDSDNGLIQVYLDESDYQVMSFIKLKILETYNSFNENLMTDCEKMKSAGNSAVVFEAIFGDLNFDFKITMIPGFLITAFFTCATFISSISMISSREDGTWDRIIVAGASPVNFLCAHFLEGFIIMMIEFGIYLLYTLFYLPASFTWNSIMLVSIIYILTGLAGLTFGLLMSIVLKTVMQSFMVSQFSASSVMFISGVMWPCEGMPLVLNWISRASPFTLPVIALRNIIVKDSSIQDRYVYGSIIILSVWIIGQLFLCYWFIKKIYQSPKLKPKK